jgi:hypothetical protein
MYQLFIAQETLFIEQFVHRELRVIGQLGFV